MEFLVGGVLLLLSISFPNQSFFSPGAKALLQGDAQIVDECAEPLPGPPNVLEAPKPDRASSFRLRGNYECHRPVFSASERDTYIELVIRSESLKAKRVAQDIGRRFRDDLAGSKTPALGISVFGSEDQELDVIVASIYRSELVNLLGEDRVRHSPARGDDFPLVAVQLRRVDAASLVSKVSLVLKGPKGEGQWQEL